MISLRLATATLFVTRSCGLHEWTKIKFDIWRGSIAHHYHLTFCANVSIGHNHITFPMQLVATGW